MNGWDNSMIYYQLMDCILECESDPIDNLFTEHFK